MIIFDTEYTSWEGAHKRKYGWAGEHREIIQIAAIRLVEGQPWQEAETFDVYVKPVLNPQLSPFITELTGISQEILDEQGEPMAMALERFAAFCRSDAAYSNGQDINPIAETCGLQKVVMTLNPRQFDSMRPRLYQQLEAFLGRSFDWGEYPSGRVYELLGLTLPTNHVHNALHDVYSLAAVLTELARQGFPVIGREGL